MDLLPGQPVRLQPYFGYRNATCLVVSARALRAEKPGFRRGSRLQLMRTMLSQFVSHEVAGLPVRLELRSPAGATSEHHATTDREGHVRFEVPLGEDWPLPPASAWEGVCLHWFSSEGPQNAEAHVLAPGRDTAMAVVSDIDDTVIETGMTGGFRQVLRNWRRVVAELPDERVAVPGAVEFYGAIGGYPALPSSGRAGERIAAGRRPFFYVSSSPWNLFSYLVAFLRGRNLPVGPLLLRDWGLDRATFGSAGHAAHKTAAIETLLGMYPELRFALIGDDTQGDLPAYAEATRRNPGRIAAVFIRKAADLPLSPEELAGKATIEAAGIPLWLGESFEAGRDFLHAVGLSLHGDTARIVASFEGAPEHA